MRQRMHSRTKFSELSESQRRAGERTVRIGCVRFGKLYETFRIRIWQGANDDGMNNTEYGDICPDPESQRCACNRGQRGVLPQCPRGITEIVHEGIEK